jgi:two-component system NtrC family sensor kinase
VAEPPVVETQEADGAEILVVDDESAIRQFLSRILTNQGHRVDTIDNASDALEKLKSDRYKLILLDIKMPGMSGIELYEHIQKMDGALASKVLFVTGDVIGVGVKDFLARTKAPYVTKPLDTQKLMKEINRILVERSA